MMNLVSLELDRLSSYFTLFASLFSLTVSMRSVDGKKNIQHDNLFDTVKDILIKFAVVEVVVPFQKHVSV